MPDEDLQAAFLCGDRRGPILTELLHRWADRDMCLAGITAALTALIEEVSSSATGPALEQLLRLLSRAQAIAERLARQCALIRQRRQREEARRGRERIEGREPRELPEDESLRTQDTSPRGPPAPPCAVGAHGGAR
jgi:hypothetical protein